MRREDTRLELQSVAVAAVRTAPEPGALRSKFGGSVTSHDSA